MTNEEFFRVVGQALLAKSLKDESVTVHASELYKLFQKLAPVMYDLFEASPPHVDGSRMRAFLEQALRLMESGLSEDELTG